MKNQIQKTQGFIYLDHTADIWVHSHGPTIKEATEECVYALMDTMIFDWPKNLEEKVKREISVEHSSQGSVLIEFLSEFLYIFDVDALLFCKVKVHKYEEQKNGNWTIVATAWGQEYDPDLHEANTEVKAITYSFLEINEFILRTPSTTIMPDFKAIR